MRYLLSLLLMTAAALAQGVTTIDATNRWSYGANVGWMNWRADAANGAVLGEFVCSGYVYAANAGWINLGSGSPANGIRYQNNSATDFGVNHDGAGNLRGYAYGSNVGWVNFEDRGAPRIDLATGKLSGFIYGANIGWISLSNAFAVVRTGSMQPGIDSDQNGLPDAWERQYFGQIGIDANADSDGDGQSNLEEYLAGTSPRDPDSLLRIISFTAECGDSAVLLTWTSTPTRQYHVLERADLQQTSSWTTNALLGAIAADAGSTTTRAVVGCPPGQRYFRIQALRP